jgi:16S rRNA processing protein RimM
VPSLSQRRRHTAPAGGVRQSGAVPPGEHADLVELGRIVNTHGVRGELRVLPHNPDSSAVLALDSLVLTHPDGVSESRRVVARRPHKQFALLYFDGVTTVEAAEALVGCTVSVPRQQLPAAGPDAVYHVDLIGCSVRTTAGQLLGTVRELIVTGSNDVCVVRGAGREYLIPLIDDVIAGLDVVARTITVHPVPGLLEA